MLRQDSIQSAELKKKESPFRAKCHEIFCCPLKQVHHKENTEPEGLWHYGSMFCLFLFFFFFFSMYVPGVCCVFPSLCRCGASDAGSVMRCVSPVACLLVSDAAVPGHDNRSLVRSHSRRELKRRCFSLKEVCLFQRSSLHTALFLAAKSCLLLKRHQSLVDSSQ